MLPEKPVVKACQILDFAPGHKKNASPFGEAF